MRLLQIYLQLLDSLLITINNNAEQLLVNTASSNNNNAIAVQNLVSVIARGVQKSLIFGESGYYFKGKAFTLFLNRNALDEILLFLPGLVLK